jgi:hypothetical protein
MNIIGGTQGAQVQEMNRIQENAKFASAIIDNGEADANSSDIQVLSAFTDLPSIEQTATFNVNFMDNMEPDSDVPLQFRSMKADCRLFYQIDDIQSISKTWSRVASGNYTCVDGGTKPGNTTVVVPIASPTASPTASPPRITWTPTNISAASPVSGLHLNVFSIVIVAIFSMFVL